MTNEVAAQLPPACTEITIAANPNGFLLALGQPVLSLSTQEGSTTAAVSTTWHTQVFLPLVSAKQLAQQLDAAIKSIEQEFGTIAIPAKAG